MDIIEVSLIRHAALRGGLETISAPFNRPHGVGWDDCLTLDCQCLLTDIGDFLRACKEHEESEDELVAAVTALGAMDKRIGADYAESRRALGGAMKLFSAIAYTFDGEHVHRLRELLQHLREEFESHLAFKEKVLFPLLRERLSAERLEELGRHARTREMIRS
ncbi:MAG: hypothetical protein COV48_12775 [Elusimicrobia bacterium CG11_big_fil_rev_8_21_14_0_20_64_6]|nr:MAG: hypothetical protein COV48_12775 [Elusimicrobia bacterium CG11_big_fil_rev_8_21_14_0_20_64_6]